MNNKNIGLIERAQTHIRTIKLLSAIGVLICAAMTLNGCVKDELHNTAHPNHGALRVQTDWSGISKDAVQPESYLLQVDELTHTVSGADNIFHTLLSAGRHTLLTHNTPQRVIISGTTATVNTLADGTLDPQPGYLFWASSELQILKDDTLKVSVKMTQNVRTLQLTLKVKASDQERIASVDAILTGIASVIDLTKGAVDVADAGKTIKPVFEFETRVVESAVIPSLLISTFRLAGVSSTARQLLTLVVKLKDGNVQIITTDMTEALKNFDSNAGPLILDASLDIADNPQQEMGFEGTISDWTPVNNEDINIH